MKILPMHMTEWRDVLVGNGALMIDIVPYLSSNFNKPQSTLFGEQCESLVSLCTDMVTRHLPDSNLYTWKCKLSTGMPASHVLTKSIEWLRRFDLSERMTLHLLTLNGNFFTFRDYKSDIHNWQTHLGDDEEARNRSGAKLLVYGDQKHFRGDQTAEGVGGTTLNILVRNIVLRMRVKIFGTSRLDVTMLDCTRGLTKVILNSSALSGNSSVVQLDWSRLLNNNDSGNCFEHDATSQTESKSAPVIMLKKFKRQGSLHEFNIVYYRMTILMVLFRPGLVRSLRELFESL